MLGQPKLVIEVKGETRTELKMRFRKGEIFFKAVRTAALATATLYVFYDWTLAETERKRPK